MIFTESDVKSILRAASERSTILPNLPALPPALELLSGGLVLEHHAKSAIAALIASEDLEGRLTLLEIATRTRLEVKKVEALLPSNDFGEWGRVGSSTIVGRVEFIRLRAIFQQQLQNNVLNVVEFCSENSVDTEFVRKLVRESFSSSDIQWLGHDRDMLCLKRFYEDCSSEVRTALDSITEPIDISNLLTNRPLPPVFISIILKSILKDNTKSLGALKGLIYTPSVFEETKKHAILDKLIEETIIDVEYLKAEGIKDLGTLLDDKLPGSKVLETHIVTAEYIMTLESMIRKLLDAEGWAEVKDSKYRLSAGDQKMLRKMIRGRIRGIEEQAGYLVAPWLKSSITEKAQSYAIQQAELVSVLGSGEEVLSVTIKWQELLAHLSGLTSVPSSILMFLLNTIYPIAAAKFTEHIKHLHSTAIATAKRDFCDKGYTRFQVHYTALDGICDTSLRSKLAGDLVEYSQDLLLAQLEKLENLMKGTEMDISPFADFKAMLQVTQKAAKPEWSLEDFERKLTTFMEAVSIPLPTGEAIAFKKKEVVGDLKTQLQKTKDGPLALTITLILLHAEQGPGVLKASGKYVPKLLKILQAKVHKNTWDELVRIKHAVTSRTQLLEDDFSRLRQIAD